MLYVKIKKLLHTIKKKDFFSENDLFVRVVYGSEIRTTTIKWNTRDPVWNEAFVFDVQPKVTKLVLQLFEQGMYKSYKILETMALVNLNAIRAVQKNIFSFDMGHMFFTTEAEVQKVREELRQKTEKVSHLVHSINSLQQKVDELKTENAEAKKHHQKISATQENTIVRLQHKLTKIMNFLDGIKNDA